MESDKSGGMLRFDEEAGRKFEAAKLAPQVSALLRKQGLRGSGFLHAWRNP